MSPSADHDDEQKLQSDWGKPRSNTGRRGRAGMGRGRAKFEDPWRVDLEDANSGSPR